MKPLEFWGVDGFEISSHSYHLHERKNKTYETSGSDNTKKCIYTYNELGFRGDSIKKEGFKIMSLGCSHTEGVGVNDWETWPYKFCEMVPNSVNCNFGTGGRSNDFISRCLLTYYDLIKPDLVLILYPQTSRREFYCEKGGIHPYTSSNPWGFFKFTDEGNEIQKSILTIQNDNEDIINWYKNHLLIKNFLENKRCNWVWDNSFVGLDCGDNNMFKGEFIRFLDFGSDGKHAGPKHYVDYSTRLINFILHNHSSFLPPNSGYKKSII